MTLADLRVETTILIKAHPLHTATLIDFYQLAADEVSDGGSETHECELAYNDMLEVVNNKTIEL